MAATIQLGTLADGIGYAGASVIALAYFLNQRGRLKSDDWRFPGINLSGSLLIMSSLFFHPNAPSIVIECFWSAISVYGVVRNYRAPRPGHANPAIAPVPPER